jgi:hypothetical protein
MTTTTPPLEMTAETVTVPAVAMRWHSPDRPTPDVDHPGWSVTCAGCGKELETADTGVSLYIAGRPVGRECLDRLARTIDAVRRFDDTAEAVNANAGRLGGFEVHRVFDIARQAAEINGTALTIKTVTAATEVLRALGDDCPF